MVLRPNLQCLVTTTSPQKIYISVISVPLGVIVLFVALVVDVDIVRGGGVGVFVVVVVISNGGNDRTRATTRGEVLVFDEVQIAVDENLVLEVFCRRRQQRGGSLCRRQRRRRRRRGVSCRCHQRLDQ